MTGVEILSSETIYNTILPECCVGIGLVFAILFAVPLALCLAYEKYLTAILPAIFMIVSTVIGCLGGTYSDTNINHIEYKVTIDDSVSMNEFLDKYEILDQEGKIYTVKERE